MVDCLIDETMGNWDAKMLEGVLIPVEAELAKKIPFARSQTEDSLFWPFTADGQYNCKSVYHFLKELETEVEEGTQSDLDKKFWKSIWSLDVPNKYKNILWHVCRESLPTKSNLNRKTIIPNPTCGRCASMAEDTLHALWGCSGLNVVWNDDRWSFRSREVFTDFKHLCGWLMENGKPLELFAIQVWCIWHQRNQSRLQQPCYVTKDLKLTAQEHWDEIRSVNPLPNPIRP